MYLVATAPVRRTGPWRESLLSLFIRCCAENQLAPRQVLAKLIVPAMNKQYFRASDNYPTQATNFGGSTTVEFAGAFGMLTGQSDLRTLTLDIFNANSAKRQIVAVDFNRRWCPACYQESTDAGATVYDQLIWSIKHVDVCRLHNVYLESHCRHCNKLRTNKVSSFEVLGFCQHCKKWLGWKGKPFLRALDAHTEFQDWCAAAAEGILSEELNLEADFRVSIANALNQMVQRDFGGVGKHAADALGRSKSLLHGWRSQTVVPRWDALLGISFVMNLPMASLLSGEQQTLPFGEFRKLPADVVNRRPPRRRAVSRDWRKIGRALMGLASDPHILNPSLKGAARTLGVSPRDLRRRCADEVAIFKEQMKATKDARKIQRRALRRSRLQLEVSIAVGILITQNIAVTKRALYRQLRLQGISLRNCESVYWLAEAKKLAGLLPD